MTQLQGPEAARAEEAAEEKTLAAMLPPKKAPTKATKPPKKPPTGAAGEAQLLFVNSFPGVLAEQGSVASCY